MSSFSRKTQYFIKLGEQSSATHVRISVIQSNTSSAKQGIIASPSSSPKFHQVVGHHAVQANQQDCPECRHCLKLKVVCSSSESSLRPLKSRNTPRPANSDQLQFIDYNSKRILKKSCIIINLRTVAFCGTN